MFGRDPFSGLLGNDPFVRDAFSHMDNMMNQMNQMFGHDPFFGGPLGPRMQHSRGQQATQRLPAPSTVIEEVNDNEPVGHSPRAGSSSRYINEPIVEEPDDDDQYNQRQSQRQRRVSPNRASNSGVTFSGGNNPSSHNRSGFSMSMGADGLPSFNSFGNGASYVSYSSSTFGSGGNGVTYQATTSSRMGPGGVRETRSTVRDGRTGQEQITISRGLGDKECVLTRTRDAQGHERKAETLKGISQEEADRFDQEWMQHAERNLWRMGEAAPSLAAPAYREPQQRYALPAASIGAGVGPSAAHHYTPAATMGAAAAPHHYPSYTAPANLGQSTTAPATATATHGGVGGSSINRPRLVPPGHTARAATPEG